MTETKDWSAMMASHAALLERRTGAGVAEWNARVRSSGADRDEGSLRAWLSAQGVTGYPQQLLVFERFGFPGFLVASADQLIDGQYSDRAQLRPILDRVLEVVAGLGEFTIQARKGYVSLVGPRRTFAVVRPTTKQRVDLGLRLEGEVAGDRLRGASGLANESITVRVELASPDAVDDDVISLLRRAYRENL
jgi:uncharacterized protein DUF5655